ncbi:Fic family protein [Thalassomonas sp. RHCl1]|uniref:Fic family protein n=1 Tax=Thalassomonas sp. RHCl1 TaxID=2995320 RepID=UPI00248B7EC5|nr:Fic family protein [Thalassomonas sp. RHCl1]
MHQKTESDTKGIPARHSLICLSEPFVIPWLKPKEQKFKPVTFCLQSFLYRYLCGGESMRSLRQVSRKKLALTGSGANYFDADVIKLSEEIAQFSKAVDIFSNNDFSVEVLRKAHGCFSIENASHFRTTAGWIGKSAEESEYMLPVQPDEIAGYLDNLVEFLRLAHVETYQKAIIAHTQLLKIHPFADLNGRTARALMVSLLRREQVDVIPPVFFRYLCSRESYLQSANSVGLNDLRQTEHDFWRQAYLWAESIENEINLLVEKVQNILVSATVLTGINADSQALLKYLWQQPLVTTKLISAKLNMTTVRANSAINQLINCQVLIPRQISSTSRDVVFECHEVMKLYQAVESKLFKVKE